MPKLPPYERLPIAQLSALRLPALSRRSLQASASPACGAKRSWSPSHLYRQSSAVRWRVPFEPKGLNPCQVLHRVHDGMLPVEPFFAFACEPIKHSRYIYILGSTLDGSCTGCASARCARGRRLHGRRTCANDGGAGGGGFTRASVPEYL